MTTTSFSPLRLLLLLLLLPIRTLTSATLPLLMTTVQPKVTMAVASRGAASAKATMTTKAGEQRLKTTKRICLFISFFVVLRIHPSSLRLSFCCRKGNILMSFPNRINEWVNQLRPVNHILLAFQARGRLVSTPDPSAPKILGKIFDSSPRIPFVLNHSGTNVSSVRISAFSD